MPRSKTKRVWPVAAAKAQFSAVIDFALKEGPQTITRSGREAVVVVSVEEWDYRTKRNGNLPEFFASSPLRGSGLRIQRSSDRARAIDL